MKSMLGNLPKGLAFVISAPAGTGKTTLVRMLIDEFPAAVSMNVSTTTRSPRPGEIPGHDYFFASKEEFEERIKADGFLEYVELFGNYYGTSKEHVKEVQAKGKHIVLVIDTQGAMALKKQHFEAVFIFVHPPNLSELRERLFKRKTEAGGDIEERLHWAEKELELAPRYDYQIVNDNLHHAYDVLRSIFIAEENKTRKPGK